MTTKNSENTIAFQGIAGAHSDMACKAAYPYFDTLPCVTFDEALQAVENGEAKYALIPIENSIAGRVAEIHNLLPHTNLHMIGEYLHTVHHCLVAPKGASRDGIKLAYSHPMALMQCRNSLNTFGIQPEPYSDTAIAAKYVADENDSTKGAIATELAAELYGLDVIEKNIEDAADNKTLFITFAREPLDIEPEKHTHILTSALFTTRNMPAGLYKALGGFATNNVNLIKLESYMPDQSSGTAQFLITFEGSLGEQKVQMALEELGFFTKNVRILGEYPAHDERF